MKMFKFCVLVAALALGSEIVKGMINGNVADLENYPFHVFLMTDNINFCSGSLVTYKHVLSSGLCVSLVQGGYKNVAAIAGTRNIGRHPEIRSIVDQVSAPRYQCNSWFNDLGIFTLSAAYPHIENRISLVSLPDVGESQVGSAAYIAAAGCSHIGGPPSCYLQTQTVWFISREECERQIPGSPIFDTSTCAEPTATRGFCSGDNGGPLMQNGVIVGVLVGFRNPCTAGTPGVFTAVYSFKKWILQITDEESD